MNKENGESENYVLDSTAFLRLKSTYRLSFADTWIAATAIFYDAILVHKDPEFEQLKGKLEMLKLPYKKSCKG